MTEHDPKAVGRAARKARPRSSFAEWAPADGRPDPVEVLQEQARDRVAELLPIRYGRMAASAFAFYRGAAAVQAWDLAQDPTTGLGVQLCGDAHLSNFGGFAAPDRQLVFDLNDFDETLPGPFEWDVQRLAASLEIAGAQPRLPPGQVRRDRAAGRQLLPPGDGPVRHHDRPRPVVGPPRRRRASRPGSAPRPRRACSPSSRRTWPRPRPRTGSRRSPASPSPSTATSAS